MAVKVERSLLQPVVGGEVRLSRGAAFLFPQAAPAAPAAAAGAAAVSVATGGPGADTSAQARHRCWPATPSQAKP